MKVKKENARTKSTGVQGSGFRGQSLSVVHPHRLCVAPYSIR